MNPVDTDAKILWEYLQLHQQLVPCDAIFVLCSMDTRVAERAAELYAQGYGAWVIVSGGSGKLTRDVFEKPEAEVFADIMRGRGVPADKIIIESKSTNTGENIRFTHQLLAERGMHPNSMLLVQKPYMERRTYATFKKQWPEHPGGSMDIYVSSPRITYEDYFNQNCPRDLVLNVMVGDMQRIREYARLGFQIPQDIPDTVWQAYER